MAEPLVGVEARKHRVVVVKGLLAYLWRRPTPALHQPAARHHLSAAELLRLPILVTARRSLLAAVLSIWVFRLGAGDLRVVEQGHGRYQGYRTDVSGTDCRGTGDDLERASAPCHVYAGYPKAVGEPNVFVERTGRCVWEAFAMCLFANACR